ncbi:unnamed protein product, partial [Closterium sp. NIES-54]
VRASTVLSCPTVPSGSLSGLHLPSFLMKLVRNAALQDVWVDTFTPGGQRVAICTCSRTGRHLATFTRRPGSSLYTLTTVSAQMAESGHVAASSRVFASGQLAASSLCQCTLSFVLGTFKPIVTITTPSCRVSATCTPVSLSLGFQGPCPPSRARLHRRAFPAWQRAAPHSSEFPPTTAPLQTLHMDVWGPTPVSGTAQERYFLLVVDDYTRYTTVFPLRRKADVSSVLIPWNRATRHQLRERFRQDLPFLRLHSDRGGEFSSGLLEEFCRDKSIRQAFTLLASPQQNGIAERRIGLIMEVARTSMIHVAAPHFLWPFAVRYAAHQLNLWPRVSKPETSPTLRWTGKVGDASMFRGLAPSGVSQVDPPPLVEPLEISSDPSSPAEEGDPAADDTAATRRSPRLETPPIFPPRASSPPPPPAAVDSRAETAGVEPRSAETEGEGFGGAASGATAADLLETLSPQAIRAWIVRRGSLSGGGYGPAGAGAASPGGSTDTGGAGCTAGGAGGGAGAGGTRGAAGAGGTGAASPGGNGGAAGAGGARATSPGGAIGAGGAGAAGTGGASFIVTIGLNVPKTKDREHRRISAQRLQTLIAFCSQLQMT